MGVNGKREPTVVGRVTDTVLVKDTVSLLRELCRAVLLSPGLAADTPSTVKARFGGFYGLEVGQSGSWALLVAEGWKCFWLVAMRYFWTLLINLWW